MAVVEQEINNCITVVPFRKDEVRQLLLDEAKLSLDITEKGILYNAEEIKPYLDPIELKSGFNRGSGITGFSLPHGYSTRGHFARWTPYSLVVEDGRPVLYDDGEFIGEITFNKGNPVSEQLLSTGEKVRDITNVTAQGGLHVMSCTAMSVH